MKEESNANRLEPGHCGIVKLRKVGIIGLGHVGAHVLCDLVNQGIADEIVLIDIDREKAECEAMDINASMAYMPSRIKVYAGTYGDIGDADVLVNASGKISLSAASNDRTNEMRYTVAAAREIAPQVRASGFNGIFLNISNPCDVITSYMARELGLPKGHVFGTGTGLDTARLLFRLSHDSGVEARSITAYMFGEHGNAQFAPLSLVSFRGKPLAEMAKTNSKLNYSQDDISKAVIQDAWTVVSAKHCTEYGIAATAASMIKIVLGDERSIMPASAMLEGEYGESGVFAGVPCLLGAGGVEEVCELPLTKAEWEMFHQCCESIRSNIALAEEM